MDFPKMYQVRQEMESPEINDIERCVTLELSSIDLVSRIKPGARIAITAGSRGITNIVRILRCVIDVLKTYGADPFIVPSMGSHGSGTAQGQVEILRHLGISKETMGVPIHSSMEVVQVGQSINGFPVLVDKCAAEADGVVVINRIKPHTEFEGPIESGLMKMMAIGLGNHEGCFEVHRQTVNFGYSNIIPEIGSIILNHIPILCGLGIVENIDDETACIRACLPEQLYEVEAGLLVKAKKYMGRLPFEKIDILLIDEMGKNISGSGMDTNVIGRIMFIGEKEPERPKITRIVVLGLTEESLGNGVGIGLADFTTQSVLDTLDREAMATNAITAMAPEKARVPVGLATDRLAVEAAFKTIGAIAPSRTRVVHIRNTLDMKTLHISHSLKKELANRTDLKLVKELGTLSFGAGGQLIPVPV